MARLFQKDFTLPEYKAHLIKLLGLFEPLEALVSMIESPLDDPARGLGRVNELRTDLEMIGISKGEIEAAKRCFQLPQIPPSGVLGYTYVVLGSRQGGRIIVNRLRPILGPAASFRFYGEGDFTDETVWQSFCLALEQTYEQDLDAICDTACATFDAYDAWLSAKHTPATLVRNSRAMLQPFYGSIIAPVDVRYNNDGFVK
jgi:heme oxygenase